MEMWLKEEQIDFAAMNYKINETIVHKKTKYQELAIVNTDFFGKMLILDGIVQLTEKDEFVYHEMITHIPLNVHPMPKKVLVIGGGDGGVIREILKHKGVEKAVLCEIDNEVIEESKRHLKAVSIGLYDERCEIYVGDGIDYVRQHKNEFDVIIVDSTDPFSIAEGLFGGNFYKDIYEALTEDGIFVAQTETPFYLPDTVKKVFNDARAIFTITKLYMAAIPTYPGGYWSFTIGSKKHNPLNINSCDLNFDELKYYTKDIHSACFVLPKYIEDLIKE